jgi:hypothetical protein
MDAKGRRLVRREMARLVLPPTKSAPEAPVPPENVSAGLIRFIEQPLFLAALSIFGGIVGLIYMPFLSVVGLCIIGAFHRAAVVKGRSWKIQIPSYLLVFAGSVACVYSVNNLIKKAVHIPTVAEIRDAVWSGHSQIPQQVTNQQVTNTYNTYNLPDKGIGEPRMDFGDFTGGGEDARGLYLTSSISNGGTTVARDVMGTTLVSLMERSQESEDDFFEQIENHADDPSGPKQDFLPGRPPVLGEGIEIPKAYLESPDFITRKKVIYIGQLEAYRDSSGKKYRTERCYFAVYPSAKLAVCTGHNWARKITQPK